MKRILPIVLIALFGIGLFSYPLLSNYLFTLHESTAVQDYDATVNQTDTATLDQWWQAAITYNQDLDGQPVHDPFVPGSGMVMDDNYRQLLDVNGDGVMGYITIPKIGVKLDIYHGTADDVLQQGAGHIEGTTLPVGGIGSHCAIAGHSGLAHAKMFTDIRELTQGDMFYLHVLNQTLAYQVDQTSVVDPDDMSQLEPVPGQDYCTLVTCTPYGINSQRLLVRGTRVPYVPETEQAQINSSHPAVYWLSEWNILVGLAVGAVVLFIVIPVAVLRYKKRKTAQIQEERREEPWRQAVRDNMRRGVRKSRKGGGHPED